MPPANPIPEPQNDTGQNDAGDAEAIVTRWLRRLVDRGETACEVAYPAPASPRRRPRRGVVPEQADAKEAQS